MRAIEIDGVRYECLTKGAKETKIDPNGLSTSCWRKKKDGLSVFDYNGHTINMNPAPIPKPSPIQPVKAKPVLAKTKPPAPAPIRERLDAFLSKNRPPLLVGASRAMVELKEDFDEAREFLHDLNAIAEEQDREIYKLSIRISELRNDFNSIRGTIKG